MDNKDIPAFPFFEGTYGYGNSLVLEDAKGNKTFMNLNPGMSLRQWYAGLSMKGCLECCANNEDWPDPDTIAEKALEYTDALIEALNKPTDSPTP